MKLSEVVARARSAIGSHTKYALGKGGFSPNSPHPWSAVGECDCSGFVAWCLGISRRADNPWYKRQNGGWVETSAIVRDAQSPYGFFDEVDWTKARPGMVVVYGDTRQGGRTRQGHVGVVSAVDAGGPIQAIHCSMGNHRRGDAIQETAVAPLWMPGKAIVAISAFAK